MEQRSLFLTPTWSIASVLSAFVLLEHLLRRLLNLVQRMNSRPLLQAVEKMKEELMLLGFISLLLTATSRAVSDICIDAKFFDSAFTPCSRADAIEQSDTNEQDVIDTSLPYAFRRALNELGRHKCPKGYEPFVSFQGFEQLRRFIFIMAVTHVSYSCLTMLLAIVKIHSWRAWEDQAHMDRNDSLSEITRDLVMQRQSSFVKFHASSSLGGNELMLWMTCFINQFGHSVVCSDYLTLRKGFIMNHHLKSEYDFHSYMIRSMEEEFRPNSCWCQGLFCSGPLWGFVLTFILFNIKGSNLYLWIVVIPIALVLLVNTKLQHIIATLTLESAGVSGFFTGTKLKPRDDLFWFKKPEFLLSMIHFILFQNSFELASFFWFWWEFGYGSCYIKNHLLVYLRLLIGFAGQFLCSYSTLPLYALVTQMGTNYKAALIPRRIRETLHGWNKSARRKRRLGYFDDSTTIRIESCSVVSLEEEDQNTRLAIRQSETELQKQDSFPAPSEL